MAGGGIGEAMLFSAAVGGGTSLLTGQDPLKGALIGATTGAVTGGVPLGGGENALPAMVEPGTQAAADLGSFAASEAGKDLASVSAAAPQVANQVTNQGIAGGIGDTVKGWGSSIGDSWSKLPEDKKWMYGGLGALGGISMLQAAMAPGVPQDNSKPALHYDRRKFRPSSPYAEGGIIALNAGGMGITSGLDNPYISNQGPLDQPMIQQVPDQQDQSYANTPAAGYLGQSVKMMSSGGISDLGGYSDGGRLLKGPGDGMSDHIPASIGGKQPARLADGEFVIPADVVSHLGNGSTDAGAKHLYSMMNKVRKARTGNAKQGKQINPAKYMIG